MHVQTAKLICWTILIYMISACGYADEQLLSMKECYAYFLPKMPNELSSNSLVINYEGFRRSMIEQCQCKVNPLGGFDKEAILFEMLDETSKTRSLVDAGGFLRDKPLGDVNVIPDEFLTKTLTMFEMYNMAGIEAVNVGYMDIDGCGSGYLKDLEKQFNIPFVSANIVDAATKEHLFKPYVLVTKKLGNGQTLRIAYVGLTRDNLKGLPDSGKPKLNYTILDEMEVYKNLLPELREKSDMIVMLYYSRKKPEFAIKAIKALTKDQRPDLVICSEFYGLDREMETIGNTRIVLSGYEGRQLGTVVVDFNSESRPVGFYNNLVDMHRTLPKVPKYQKLIDETLQSFKSNSVPADKIILDE